MRVFMDWLLSPFTVLIKLYVLEVKMSFFDEIGQESSPSKEQGRGQRSKAGCNELSEASPRSGRAKGPLSPWLVMLSWFPAPAHS